MPHTSSSRTRRPAREGKIASKRVRATPLPRVFELRDSARVKSYLTSHPFLSPVLRDLARELSRHFNGLKMALEVMDDPESENDRMLFALVNAGSLTVAEARRRLNEFDRSWTAGNESRLLDALCVSLEFR